MSAFESLAFPQALRQRPALHLCTFLASNLERLVTLIKLGHSRVELSSVSQLGGLFEHCLSLPAVSAGRLRAPEHVLGRAAEVALLFHCYKRVAASKSLEVVLISGYSGIGKTSLVGELMRTSPTGREALVQGKFDQYTRDTPFKAFIAAMQVRPPPLTKGSLVIKRAWEHRPPR